ncbi:hypothetical protein [Streptomyces sp. SID5643]|uniref:hypothetical protein n=1 Tax=Streptomyces sp. SID5643 TaxID=2690307 RepID=UPI001368C15F|nr:hypothetical protein [Streptomyces sp. SID5643]MZF88208.1 hypothetical protein [Streptomyces sp. SID5643]
MTDEPPAHEPLWASFRDVVEQLTGPLAASTIERVAEETERLDKSLAELRKGLSAVAVEQDDIARALKKRQESLLRGIEGLRGQLEAHETRSAAAHDDTAALLRELSRFTADARASTAALEAVVEDRLARFRTSLAVDVEAMRARQSATERWGRMTVVMVFLTFVLAAVGVVVR